MRQVQKVVKEMPNDLLRQERQRRGWSRSYIAEAIGVADPKTIGRWERGDAFPSAFFLQKLCALFAMPAEDLGLWQREQVVEPAVEAPVYLTKASTAPTAEIKVVLDPALPPAPLERLVGRDDLLRELRQQLCGHEGSVQAALSGWPGVGKTALAIHLAHDGDVRQRFVDGILWANLGPECEPLDELRRWGRLLEVDESQFVHSESLEEWGQAIHARIGERALLLVIDDAWTCQDALAFKIGGPNCAYFVTTRIPAVALYFAERAALRVPELDSEQSLRVLARFVPELIVQESVALRGLVKLAGGLPLALHLLGTHLRAHFYSGQPRRWLAAIERLKQQAGARLHLTMPRAPLERQMGLPADAPISLYNEIELSYQRLPLEARSTLGSLASLSQRGGIFSEEEALARADVTLEALDCLLDAGLLASAGLGIYTMHRTIVDFAAFQSSQEQRVAETPPQLSSFRHLRSHTGYSSAELAAREPYTLSEVVPTLVQGASESAIV